MSIILNNSQHLFLYFQGDTGSIIQYDEFTRSWSLKKDEALVMSTGLEKLVSYGLRTLTWKLEKEICPTDNLDQVIHGLLTVCSVSKAI